jgi:hypothetical protein
MDISDVTSIETKEDGVVSEKYLILLIDKIILWKGICVRLKFHEKIRAKKQYKSKMR